MRFNYVHIKYIAKQYETISIQTKQITVNGLTMDKINKLEFGLVRLTINSKEDVIIDPEEIKAVYGKNRR